MKNDWTFISSHRLLIGRLLTGLALVLLLRSAAAEVPAQTVGQISLRDRIAIASRIYHQIMTCYPELNERQFQEDYNNYLDRVLRDSDDRRIFDLASIALVASLHDGHTWFYDKWLSETHGQPVGFRAYRINNRWLVVRSDLATITPGDVVEAINTTTVEQYFQQNRRYISASSERDAATLFFDTPVVFPEQFTITLDGGRKIAIDRRQNKRPDVARKTEGRWLDSQRVGYISIPTFNGLENQAAALSYIKQFHQATLLIIDLRGNPGAGDPELLRSALMTSTYPTWSAVSRLRTGLFLRSYSSTYSDIGQVATETTFALAANPIFTGGLVLLIDRGCASACEDFAMAFKWTKRAQLFGETTAGTFSFTKQTMFENGMALNVTAVRHAFPDGSRFEGVGIAPDVEILRNVEDLRAGKDTFLERARAVAAQR